MKTTKTALLIIFCCLTAALANAGELKIWKVQPGETLGNIIWTLNQMKPPIETARLKEWNPDLGTAVSAGQEIRYYLPETPKPAATVGDIRTANSELGKDLKRQLAKQKEAEARERNQFLKRVYEMSGGVAFVVILGALFVWRGLRARNTKQRSGLLVMQPREEVRSLSFDQAFENLSSSEIMSYVRTNPNISSFDVGYDIESRRIVATIRKDDAGIYSGSFKEFPNVTPCAINKIHKTAVWLISGNKSQQAVS